MGKLKTLFLCSIFFIVVFIHPSIAKAVSSFTFTGPVGNLNVNNSYSNFTITPDGTYNGTVTITPSGSASTGLSPINVIFNNSFTPQNVAFTPTATGTLTLTPTSNPSLNNPSPISYTVYPLPTISSVSGGGNWSNANTWVGGVVPGDGDFVNIEGPVVIDQNIGSVAGGGIYRITLDKGTSALSVDNSASRTILFHSTGTNPVGSGNGASPGYDATMYGIYILGSVYGASNGSLSLVGTQANPVTIKAANNTSPIYISNPNEFPYTYPTNITLKYVDLYNLGVGGYAGDFDGIDMVADSPSTPTIMDIENCRFTSPYVAVLFHNNNLNFTFNNNYITGSRSTDTLRFWGVPNSTTIENNTEVSPAVSDGTFFTTVYGISNLIFTGNAVLGSSSNNRYLIDFDGGGSSGTNTIQYNVNYNSKASNGYHSIVGTINSGTTTIDSNIAEGSESFGHLGSSVNVNVTHNLSIPNKYSYLNQGVIVMPSGIFSLSDNLVLYTDTTDLTTAVNGFFDYSAGPSITARYSHNTLFFADGLDATGITHGEPNYKITNDIDKDNIIYEGPSNLNGIGIWDGEISDTFANDFNGVGVHHNDVYGANTAYCGTATACAGPYSSGFQNGSTTHPDASYGDVTIDPKFFDTTRDSLTQYDSRMLGGPGTVNDLFTKLSYRSGWGGTYTLGSSPVNDAINWIFAGFAPNNVALSTAASDGTTIGAVSYVSPTATTFTFTNGGSSSGNAGATSGTFTVTPNNLYNGTITITPTGPGSTGLSVINLPFSNSSTPQTFTITPTVAGSITLTPTSNNPSLTNPSNLTYTVNAVVPNAPTIGTATAGDTQATVTFSAPGFNGGSVITGYTVTSSSGGTDSNAGSTSLSHVITGLTNGTPYTFTVHATNTIGNSAESSATSPAVTPMASVVNNTVQGSGSLYSYSTPQVYVSPATTGVPSQATTPTVSQPVVVVQPTPLVVSALPQNSSEKTNSSLLPKIVSNRNLSIGVVKGNDIKQLQIYLNSIFKMHLIADGIFGKQTYTLVKKWQKDHNLNPDGVVGPKTRAIMNGK